MKTHLADEDQTPHEADQAGATLRGSDRYAASNSSRWSAAAIVTVLHAALFFAILKYGMTFVSKRHSQRPLVVTLVPLPTSPTPVRPEKRRLATLPAKAEPQRVSAPSPIVPTPSEPIVIVSNVPSPPSPPVVERQPDPTPSGPVAVNDLATRLISATPPRYPMQSRHDHESGVVTLLVTLGEDGSVETVSISQSSGYKRLDAAASGAVRKWRWSPTMINGRAVRIQGLVRIPFELREGAP